MSSKPSFLYYQDLRKMSRTRAMAETIMNDPKVRKITIAEAYQLALKQPGVSETDLEIYPKLAEKYRLPKGAKVLNDCHGKIVGRTAKARIFYNRIAPIDKSKIEGDLREAIFQMEKSNLIKAEAVIGLDKDLMFKATFVTTVSDAANVFSWLCNFTPYEILEEDYKDSKKHNIQDIIIVAFNEWVSDDSYYHSNGGTQLALVDEKHNVIFNFGMRYFGERKKGTLTLAWTSGMRIGMAACHGGIKEVDFSYCEDPKYYKLGKRSIAFYGLSGTGKSSHTNSHDNNGTMPKGAKKVVLHDDAFQIDLQEKICRVWEPSLFDKTDSRDIDHPDWKYTISLMNHSLINIKDKLIPVGMDLRQQNGRALFDRDLLGEWVNRCSFPKALAWLMKDTTLPPIVKYVDNYLSVAMGTTLMTKRSGAENISKDEISRLVFEPFANPFRVYELYRDAESFLHVFEIGAECYTFNSAGFWKTSDNDLEDIDLNTSLTLQTAVLTNQLSWEEWDLFPGALLPTEDSINKIIPGYYEKFNPGNRLDQEKYHTLFKSRIELRREFLKSTDIRTKPELLDKLLNSLRCSLE